MGWRCVVPHFRGCSGELNRLPRAYHSGDSAELDWILQRLGAHYAVGISLGGNALLKLLGEKGAAIRVRKAAAISAPPRSRRRRRFARPGPEQGALHADFSQKP